MNQGTTVQPKKRRQFTNEEDCALSQLVQTYGMNKWFLIASHMPGRSSRQCRERYINYLSPTIKNQSWTIEEEILLNQKIKLLGFKWTEIARYFPNRSVINIKNHWAFIQRNFKSIDIFQALCQNIPLIETNVQPLTIYEDFPPPKVNKIDDFDFPTRLIPADQSPISNIEFSTPLSIDG